MKKALLLALAFICTLPAMAHTINYQLDEAGQGEVFLKYLFIGFEHIIPAGFDHILFIVCLFFLSKNIKTIILQASMFTLAHSITLGLAMYGTIDPPPAIMEPLIALSIVLLAVENIVTNKLRPWRIGVIFLFGLVHGMGFAGALSEFGIPRHAFASALISFNIGVELGQLAIIATLYFLLSKTVSEQPWYRKIIVIPANALIAIFAAYLTIERTFF